MTVYMIYSLRSDKNSNIIVRLFSMGDLSNSYNAKVERKIEIAASVTFDLFDRCEWTPGGVLLERNYC